MELQEKKAQKDYIGNLFRKNLQLIDVLLILDLETFRLLVKGKHSIGRKLGSSCVTKETADIDILVTQKNCDRKIMRSIRITSRPPLKKRKWNQFS